MADKTNTSIPAPWELHTDSEGFLNIHHPSEDGRTGDLVAVVFQDDAHANLIKAAPVMLAALSDAIGVGNKPCPVAAVRGTNGERWNAIPLRIVPDRGQRSENEADPSIQQLWAVFQSDIFGSYLANEAEEFPPQSASLAIESKAGTARRKVLAGKASTDDIDGNSIGSKPLCGEFSNIMVARHLWPVFRQHAAGEFLNLAERYGLETASSLTLAAMPVLIPTERKIEQEMHI